MHAPSPRYGAVMSFDAARGVCVLFGGLAADNTLLSDTWEYDGIDWVLRVPAHAPSARFRAAMCFDTWRSRSVLFGGYRQPVTGLISNELWEFDGADWIQRTSTSPWPAASATQGMAFDARRGRVVMYGSAMGSSSPTYEWDGSQWISSASSPRPSAVQYVPMAFDAARERIVLTKGLDGSGASRGETWEWDGGAWTLRSSGEPQIGRTVCAWDAHARRLLVFSVGRTSLYGPVHDAERSTVGAGCAGSGGVPRLSVPRAGPFAGEDFVVRAESLPASPFAASMGILGFDTTQWGGLALPLDLGILGMPGCVLRNDIVQAWVVGVGRPTLEWSVAIPSDATLYGLRFQQTVLAADPAANPLGLVIGNQVLAEIGTR